MTLNELPRSRAARYPFPKQIISLAKQSFEEFDPKRLKHISREKQMGKKVTVHTL
jgi:hypothetical protein